MTSTEEKSEDKKEIEDEEREKMLNEENARDSQPPAAAPDASAPASTPAAPEQKQEEQKEASTGAAPRGEVEKMKKALEEQEKEAARKKIPIGGIRIPGFLRSRSREKNNKDAENELEEENKDLLPDSQNHERQDKDSLHDGQTPPPRRLPPFKLIPNPFKKGKDTEVGQAGLASMETLDDKSAADTAEDGMESVKLDVDEKDGEKAQEAGDGKDVWQERIRFLMKHRFIIGFVALFVVLVIAIFAIAFSGSQLPVVLPRHSGRYMLAPTSCGFVEGIREEGGYSYRGIPYAAPPLGEQRWRPARLASSLDDCWNGTLRAHNATPSCLQLNDAGEWEGEENCLTLDVFTPYVGYDKPVPVVVMIGADTMLGGSPGALLPSAKVAHDRDLVLVRPNFRLGVLGFLAHDSLSRTTYPYTSGNYGLSDILAVLKWVKLNVQHFGGDKDQVTVLGHRAGATMVSALMTSREAKGLFQRVWLSSGAATFPGKPLSESSSRNARLVNNVAECREQAEDNELLAACLRSVNVSTLLSALPDAWRPQSPALPAPDAPAPHEWLVLDGDLLRRHPFEVFANDTLPFAVVLGTTQHVEDSPALRQKYNEWASSGGEAGSEDAARSHIARWLESLEPPGANQSLAEQAFRLYGGASYPSFAAMVSDIRSVCPLLDMWNRMKQSNPVFYVATEGRGDPTLSDASLDVDAISSRFLARTVQERRHINAMQHVFFPYAHFGTVRHDGVKGHKEGGSLLLIGQDANPSVKYPNCDLWLGNDVVPRYARVD